MKFLISLLAAAVFLSTLFCSGRRTPNLKMRVPEGQVWWDVLPVSQKTQADANLLRFSDGTTILIDAGESAPLVPQLEKLGVKRIDKILVSHPHIDHYSGIFSLLKSEIKIGEVDLNVPAQSVCDREKDWGCHREEVLELVKQLEEKQVVVKPVKAGDLPVTLSGVRLEVLYVYDGVHTPVGPTDANDMSAVQLLTVGKMRVLFAGDLNRTLGTYLLGLHDPRLQAELLKVPHHGAEAVAPNGFFEWVSPQAGFVPAQKELWNSERGTRVKAWFAEKKTSVYVTGLVGRVHVELYPEQYRIFLPNY